MKYFIYTIISIVIIAIIAGFFIVGSPEEERLRRFDQKRIRDLQFLQSEIVNYWRNKERLPENLAILKDDIRGISVPKDPETGVDYTYEIKNLETLTFSLCANFNRSNLAQSGELSMPSEELSIPSPKPYYGGESWQHKAGFVCFERKIDKEIYKPR